MRTGGFHWELIFFDNTMGILGFLCPPCYLMACCSRSCSRSNVSKTLAYVLLVVRAFLVITVKKSQLWRDEYASLMRAFDEIHLR